MENEKKNESSENGTGDIRQTIDNLLNGLSISKVPESIHPKLLMPLSAAKNEAIVAGNIPLVKRIQTLMKSLKLNQTSNGKKSSKDATTRKRGIIPASSAIKAKTSTLVNESGVEEPIEVLVDELIEGRPTDTIDNTMLPTIITALKAKKEELISTGCYHKLQATEDLIQEFNSRFYESAYNNVRSDRVVQIQQQLNEAQQELQDMENHWNEQKDSFENEYRASREQLIKDQEVELIQYDESFPDILPVSYRKLSPTVLQLREQEKHLVLTKRYQEAIEFRARADEIEQKELAVQREKFVKAFNDKRKQLLEQQKNTFKCFEENWKRKFLQLEKDRNFEVIPLRNAIEIYKKKLSALERGSDDSAQANVSNRGVKVIKSSLSNSSLSRSRMRNTSSQIYSRVRSVAAPRISSRMTPISSTRSRLF